MFERLPELLAFRVKSIAIGLAALGFGLICWKFMSAYFDRNQTAWETNLQADVAELMVLADSKISEANMKVQWECGGFSLSGKDEGPGCAPARAALAAAEKNKADVEAKRAQVLSQAGQTKKYYDGLVASSKQKPLPFNAFVAMGGAFLMLLAGALYFFMPSIQRAVEKRRNGSCSADGLE